MKTPVQVVFEAFGGYVKVAEHLDLSPTNVYRWGGRQRASRLAGLVPSEHQKALLDAAKTNGIKLSAHSMIYGKK